ncbi:MAG: ATP-dependent carboxylate-amine ligase, partial [Actinomycetota bacterium]|nr:ATP-dependent carboxylate-amine ligase [Actinomycetota bacterium]
MRVLFTGGGGAGTSALWSLLDGRYEIHAADADPTRISPIIPRDRAHHIPMGSDPKFLASLRELCARIEIDVLVPGVDEELLPIAEH